MKPEQIINAVLKEVWGTKAASQDKSVMIRLTPDEILNICKMGAKYWSNAKDAETTKSMDEVCQFHVDVAIGILRQTDPDRFENSN